MTRVLSGVCLRPPLPGLSCPLSHEARRRLLAAMKFSATVRAVPGAGARAVRRGGLSQAARLMLPSGAAPTAHRGPCGRSSGARAPARRRVAPTSLPVCRSPRLPARVAAGLVVAAQVAQGALLGAVECAAQADVFAALGRAQAEVPRERGARAEGRRGQRRARHVQGPRGQGDPVLPAQVGHPHRADRSGKGERCVRRAGRRARAANGRAWLWGERCACRAGRW